MVAYETSKSETTPAGFRRKFSFCFQLKMSLLFLMVEPITKVFQERDEMTATEAHNRKANLRNDILNALEHDETDYSDVEDMMLDEGLEMDYFEELFG